MNTKLINAAKLKWRRKIWLYIWSWNENEIENYSLTVRLHQMVVNDVIGPITAEI